MTLPAGAQGTVGRVRAENALRCAAEPRPGFADTSHGGGITGLAVDLCRAIAIALLGPASRVEVSLVAADNQFEPLRHGAADVMFLSGAAIVDHHLGDFL